MQVTGKYHPTGTEPSKVQLLMQKRPLQTQNTYKRRRITYQQLEKSLGIGSAAFNTIFNDNLKYRKLVSRWVTRSLTEDQKLVALNGKKNGNLLFGALQNHLLLRKFAELEVLENKWSLWRFASVEALFHSSGTTRASNSLSAELMVQALPGTGLPMPYGLHLKESEEGKAKSQYLREKYK
ncbi:hypothetical protein LAZ67_16002271 [Cordylochernes scorpioides]|uniref:Uncharacterized protein n=1 Tax=Cordylochernes scorpioides TaxID=51811 RepID=A0ABY6LD58_9ARAC|nr:hypothetical protein LAZ67_16002271 [Cordylochernes scorpioides]